MAIAIVNRKQTTGVATATLTIPSATAGNLLVAFIQKAGSLTTVKGKDNISGETGWTVNATSAPFFTSADSIWVATKIAVGGETELNPAANGGTLNGISYFELSGTEGAVDAISHADNVASAATGTSAAITTTDAGSWVFVGIGLHGGGTGTITAWTGGPPTLTNTETGTTRCMGGAGNPGGTLTGATFTGNWTTAHTMGILAVAFKPTAEGAGVSPETMLL